MTDVRLIKKYKNRRLYDTAISQYITIEDLKHYSLKGILFKVEEASTHNNLTNITLFQILADMETSSSQIFTENTLRQCIILAQHPLNQAFKTMLEQMLGSFDLQKEGNPFWQDMRKATEIWQEQSQKFMQQWEDLLQKNR